MLAAQARTHLNRHLTASLREARRCTVVVPATRAWVPPHSNTRGAPSAQQRAHQDVQAAAGGPVPDARGEVVGDGDRDGRGRRHAHAVQAPGVPRQHVRALARGQVPDPARRRPRVSTERSASVSGCADFALGPHGFRALASAWHVRGRICAEQAPGKAQHPRCGPNTTSFTMSGTFLERSVHNGGPGHTRVSDSRTCAVHFTHSLVKNTDRACRQAHRAVKSWLAVSACAPSAVIATSTTQPLWPSSTASQAPAATFQTRAVKSSLATTARRPSGVSAIAHTTPARPRRSPGVARRATSLRSAPRRACCPVHTQTPGAPLYVC